MVLRLRTNLTFCAIEQQFILLDILNDRYFRLDTGLDAAFHDFAVGRTLSVHDMARLVTTGILEDTATVLPPLPTPAVPRRTSPAIAQGGTTGFEIARALVAEWIADRRLGRTSLYAELQRLRRVRRGVPIDAPDPDSPGGEVIRAFEQAKRVKSAVDRCLPRSIAMVGALARARTGAHLVLGVRLMPFKAHAWVQAHDDVLSDPIDMIAGYTPIFWL